MLLIAARVAVTAAGPGEAETDAQAVSKTPAANADIAMPTRPISNMRLHVSGVADGAPLPSLISTHYFELKQVDRRPLIVARLDKWVISALECW